MDVSQLVLVEPPEQGNEVWHGLPCLDCITESINDGFLVISLGVLHLSELLLDDAELLQVLGVVRVAACPVPEHQATDVFMRFLQKYYSYKPLLTYLSLAVEVLVVTVALVGAGREVLKNNSGSIGQIVGTERVLVDELDHDRRLCAHSKLLVFGLNAHLDENFALQLRHICLLCVNIVKDNRGVVSIHHGAEIAHQELHANREMITILAIQQLMNYIIFTF